MSGFWQEFARKLELTEDDKGAVRDILASPGWKVLTHKVWPGQEYTLLVHASLTKDVNSLGKYEGVRLCQEVAERIGRPKPEQPPTPNRPKSVHLQRQNQRGSKPL